MSWIQTLCETYDACAGSNQSDGGNLPPLSHIKQQAHLEIVVSTGGDFLSATVLHKEMTLIPVTEKSAGRSKGPVAHPLCDKLKYVAADYVPPFGNQAVHFLYLQQLRVWAASDPNPKLSAILRYVEKAQIVADLVRSGLLFQDGDGRLLTQWTSSSPTPDIFRILPVRNGQRDPGDALVRWRVKGKANMETAVWLDLEIQRSWIRFDTNQGAPTGLCMATGEFAPLALSHPKYLRHGADTAKLISSNDARSGYTFRGRFASSDEAYSISAVVTQKAHHALRWLIVRAGERTGDQVIVAWTLKGQWVPPVLAGTEDLLRSGSIVENEIRPEFPGDDVEMEFSQKLSRFVAGCASQLGNLDNILVLAVDSATLGRMAITYYRELHRTEYLSNIQNWHERIAWPQYMGKRPPVMAAPAARDIAKAAYGKRIDDKLLKSTVERLLPCIVERRPIPIDLVKACARRAINHSGQDHSEWEWTLGIACALVRGSRGKLEHSVSLEEGRNSRDYLFGRLLAVADRMEGYALYLQAEQRDTTAQRLMQRFAEHPAATWRTIELSLQTYTRGLPSSCAQKVQAWRTLLDHIAAKFDPDDFNRLGRLDPEFLLGYHCQRAALIKRADTSDRDEVSAHASGHMTNNAKGSDENTPE